MSYLITIDGDAVNLNSASLFVEQSESWGISVLARIPNWTIAVASDFEDIHEARRLIRGIVAAYAKGEQVIDAATILEEYDA